MKLLILDRDGVINFDSAAYIKTAEEWQPLPGSIGAITAFCSAGFEVVVATNQSAIGRGLLGVDELHAIHSRMHHLVEQQGGRIADVFFCPHLPEDNCRCRKPNTGLLEAIESKYECRTSGCWLVGDSMADIELARRKGCLPILVRTGNGRATENLLQGAADVRVFDDLACAARALLAEH